MRWLALICVLLGGWGCSPRLTVRPDDLKQLDGYNAYESENSTKVVDGIAYHRGRVLELHVKPDERREGGEFLSIHFAGYLLRGELSDGRHIAIDLRDVEDAEIRDIGTSHNVVPVIIGGVIVVMVWSLEIWLSARNW